MGYEEWDRSSGRWSDEDEDKGKRKPVDKSDLDIVVPTEDIGETDPTQKDIDKKEIPDKEIPDDDLYIVPNRPDVGEDEDSEKEAIIRQGILDDLDKPEKLD